MFVTVVVIMCHLVAGCKEEIVTDSSMSDVTFFACMSNAQAPIAKWKSEHPIYRNDAWRVSRYKCVPGHYEPKGSA